MSTGHTGGVRGSAGHKDWAGQGRTHTAVRTALARSGRDGGQAQLVAHSPAHRAPPITAHGTTCQQMLSQTGGGRGSAGRDAGRGGGSAPLSLRRPGVVGARALATPSDRRARLPGPPRSLHGALDAGEWPVQCPVGSALPGAAVHEAGAPHPTSRFLGAAGRSHRQRSSQLQVVARHDMTASRVSTPDLLKKPDLN
jgi:hypothetical protein